MRTKRPSVQYRYVFVSEKYNQQGEEGWVICGQFNAKNAYGTYVGFAPFIATPDDDGTMSATSEPVILNVISTKVCGSPIKKLVD